MIKAVIFDMDGIIFDSDPLQKIAINQILAKWNVHVTEEDFENQMVGPYLLDDFRFLKGKFHLPIEFHEFMKLKNHSYFNVLQQSVFKEMPGVSGLLKELKMVGMDLAVASNSLKEEVNMILRKLGIYKFFKVITSGDEVRNAKPNPEIYILTVERLKVKAEECIVIEDSKYGIEAANSIGIKCIAVPQKYTLNHDFKKASKVVNFLDEITLTILQNL